MTEFKTQKIKKVIKDLLKKKGLTYEDVAEHMECSVPTVKRILGTEELTLNRLLELCELVEVDLAELDALTQENQEKPESFSESQQNFLAKNKSHFAYLMKLFEGKTPTQIAETFKLSQRSTDKYLIALEKHDLIKVTGRQKVKPAFKNVPHLGKGILAKTYTESFIRNAASFFIHLINKALYDNLPEAEQVKSQFTVQTMSVSPETFKVWKEENERSLRELAKLSTFEEKAKDSSELKTAVIIYASTMVEKDYEGLKIVDGTMGEITNF